MPVAARESLRALGRLAVVIVPLLLLLWHWVGNRPEAKCVAACCLILPTMAGALCCVGVGGCIRLLAESSRPKARSGIMGRLVHVLQSNHAADRMDLPMLGGIVLATVLACSFTPMICGAMCRIYQVSMCVSPCQTILPSIIFASMSSTLAYIIAFGPRTSHSS